MSILKTAIKNKRWDLAALVLLYAAVVVLPSPGPSEEGLPVSSWKETEGNFAGGQSE
jgi:hypothetical protein